jgi:hypothetical protein
MSPLDEDPTLAARRLPRSVQPVRDLWPDIEARLEASAPESSVPIDPSGAKPRRRGLRMGMPGAAMAAAALAACAIVWVAVRWIAVDVPPGVSDATGHGDPEGAGFGRVAVNLGAPPALLEARVALAGHLYQQLAALPSETRDVVLTNLNTINNALDEIDRALQEAPDSGLDRPLLTSLYADQLARLTDMNAMIRRANQETSL